MRFWCVFICLCVFRCYYEFLMCLYAFICVFDACICVVLCVLFIVERVFYVFFACLMRLCPGMM